MADALSHLSIRYAEARCPERIDAALTLIEPVLPKTHRLIRCHLLVARSQRLACDDAFERAIKLLQEALDTHVECGEMLQSVQWAALLVHHCVQAGRFEQAVGLVDHLMQEQGLGRHPLLSGSRFHALAVGAFHRDNATQASAWLDQAIETLPPSRWRALAQLDAAWLAIERGDLHAARELRDATKSWVTEHPVGMAVNVRLLFAQGSAELAYRELERLALLGGRVLPGMGSLIDVFNRSTRGLAITLATGAHLPSML